MAKRYRTGWIFTAITQSTTGRYGCGWRRSIFRGSVVSFIMKSRAAITFVTLLAALTIMEARGQTSNPAMNEPQQNGRIKDPKEMYPRLRTLMLQGSRAKFGLIPTSKPTEPWGVVMDWGV